MVNDFLKTVLVKGWELSAKRNLRNKFKLYGPYKEIYSWGKYKRIKEHKEIFKPLGCSINTEWYRYFTLVRQKEDPRYFPEDIWHLKIEPVLNQRSYAKANNDKNLFHTLQEKALFPHAYLHIIIGKCYNKDFHNISYREALECIPDNKPFVVKKAINSGGGKGITFYNSKASILDIQNLIKKHGDNFVVQEKVIQSEWFKRFNPTSINTIRVVTYRSVIDEQVHVLQMVLRVGKKDMEVDNQSSGGIAIGIDENGKLNNWGCDKLSQQFTSVNDLELASLGEIPLFEQLKETCINLAKRRFHERVLVFDTWRDENNRIRLLEINNINIGIEDLQKNNGPLFGQFTEEVIEYCSKNKKFYCFDFEL